MDEICQTKKKKEKILTANTEGKTAVLITSKKFLPILDNPHAKQ